MKIIRIILLFFLAAGVVYIIVLNIFIRKSNHIQILNVDDFENILADKKDKQLIDLRTPREFKKQHISDAININYLSIDFRKRIKKLDKTKPTMLYCHSGYRSKMALLTFYLIGFRDLYELDTGFSGWFKTQKPIDQCNK